MKKNNNKTDSNASCMDEYDPGALTVQQAKQKISASIAPIQGNETLPIKAALGRILHEDIISPSNVPGHDYSAMDGYALSSVDLPDSSSTQLNCIGTLTAGSSLELSIMPGQCIRIMTGAKIPKGADTVIMQERVVKQGDLIQVGVGHLAGENIRLMGEDITLGTTVLSKGRRILPADIGLLASLGIGEINVTRTLKVAFFSTGDELKSIGEPLLPGQIYDSNRYTLSAMLNTFGADTLDMGLIADNKTDITTAFNKSLAAHADVIITTGGVSVGDADYVKEILLEIGNIHFWKIAMKPGRPLTFGKIKNCWFFGLPGNPVSAMVTFYIFVLPALRKLSGQTVNTPITFPARCLSNLKKRAGREDYQRGIFYRESNGEFVVRSTGEQGSGVLSSMSKANCFIILPLECTGVKAGEMVEIMPLGGIEY